MDVSLFYREAVSPVLGNRRRCGPSGLFAAYALTEKGLPVLLLERVAAIEK